MRVRTFFTINNQYKDQIYYGLYETGDTVFVKTDSGHGDTLDAGKAIEMEVPFRKCKIVFWKSAPVFGLGEKLADPKEIATDRPVTLTKAKQVEQPAEPDFTDPEHTGAVVFLTEMQGNNIIRGLVVAALGKIPEVGGAISGILGFVWPEQQPDLIAESEARMKKWVQGRFDAYDREFLQHELTGLRRQLNEYVQAMDQGERARWFDIVLGACERAMPFFTKSQYRPGTIDLAASVATLHLALLRERVLFAADIFEDKKIVVYAGDKIDGLQFNADKRLGKHYGGYGGKRHFVHPPAGAFFTKVETWFDFDLYAIRFHFSDGSSSLTFGTPGRGGVHQTAEFPRHHLTAVRVGSRLEELRCGFTPLPDYYESLAH